MDTLKQQAERSPIDTIAGHLDSKIDALRLEMLTAISSLKELDSHGLGKLVEHQEATRAELLAQIVNLNESKSHDLIKLADRQDMLSAEVCQRLDDLEQHLAACAPREVYERWFTAQETAMRTAFREYARSVEVAQLAQGKAVVAAFDAQEKAITSAMEAAERAVGKSEIASENRFESANKFYAQPPDEAVTLLPRAEFDCVTSTITDKIEASNKSLIDRLDGLRSYRDTPAGKSAKMNAGWAVLIGLVTLVATVLTVATFFRR
jgi:hypothetical protein